MIIHRWLTISLWPLLAAESSVVSVQHDQKRTKEAKIRQAKGGYIEKDGHSDEFDVVSGTFHFVSSANPDLKLLAFDPDYDFNLPAPPEVPGDPVVVNVSLNLRNILEVTLKSLSQLAFELLLISQICLWLSTLCGFSVPR